MVALAYLFHDSAITAFLCLCCIVMVLSFCYVFLRTFIVIAFSVFADDPVAFVERYGFKNSLHVERPNPWLW